MNDLKQRFKAVLTRVEHSCERAGRDPASVRLLAVSKRQPAERVRALHALGQRAFGENFVQEARDKQAALQDLDIEWHHIGPVQSNKTRDLAEHFDWVQGVDRIKIADRLARQRPRALGPLNVLVQVNVDDEPQKGGVSPQAVDGLAAHVAAHAMLRLRGLMAIPRAHAGEAATRASFRRLRECFERLRGQDHALDTLSIGMSADLEWAILEGSTMVRVGSDLMGPRN